MEFIEVYAILFQIYVKKNLCGENLCGDKMTNMRSGNNKVDSASTFESFSGRSPKNSQFSEPKNGV